FSEDIFLKYNNFYFIESEIVNNQRVCSNKIYINSKIIYIIDKFYSDDEDFLDTLDIFSCRINQIEENKIPNHIKRLLKFWIPIQNIDKNNKEILKCK